LAGFSLEALDDVSNWVSADFHEFFDVGRWLGMYDKEWTVDAGKLLIISYSWTRYFVFYGCFKCPTCGKIGAWERCILEMSPSFNGTQILSITFWILLHLSTSFLFINLPRFLEFEERILVNYGVKIGMFEFGVEVGQWYGPSAIANVISRQINASLLINDNERRLVCHIAQGLLLVLRSTVDFKTRQLSKIHFFSYLIRKNARFYSLFLSVWALIF
jgi:hypothetical protein